MTVTSSDPLATVQKLRGGKANSEGAGMRPKDTPVTGSKKRMYWLIPPSTNRSPAWLGPAVGRTRSRSRHCCTPLLRFSAYNMLSRDEKYTRVSSTAGNPTISPPVRTLHLIDPSSRERR